MAKSEAAEFLSKVLHENVVKVYKGCAVVEKLDLRCNGALYAEIMDAARACQQNDYASMTAAIIRVNRMMDS